jgi:hypothetical protein
MRGGSTKSKKRTLFREIICSLSAYVLEFDGNYLLSGPVCLVYVFSNYYVLVQVN